MGEVHREMENMDISTTARILSLYDYFREKIVQFHFGYIWGGVEQSQLQKKDLQ